MTKKQAVGTTVKFEDMLNEALRAAKEAEALRKEAEEKARQLKRDEVEKYQAVTRLNRIAYLAGYSYNPMEWHKREFEHMRSDLAWREYWELETSMLEFAVVIEERTDLKKWKYVVNVYAKRRTLSDNPREVHGGYTDFDYGKRVYMKYISYGNYEPIPGQEMEKKFTKKEDALAFARQWMERLYNDHKDEIEQERAYYNQVKATGFKYDDKRRLW